MKFRRCVLIVVLAIVAPLAAQDTQPKRSITEKDLFDFIWVANPQLSPDGTRVTFTRVNVDDKKTGYETSIWLVAIDGKQSPIRLTSGKHDASPRWSPDGSHIAFVRGGEKDETGKSKEILLIIDGVIKKHGLAKETPERIDLKDQAAVKKLLGEFNRLIKDRAGFVADMMAAQKKIPGGEKAARES